MPKNTLDEYDVNKLKEAKRLVLEVYEYNYKSSDPISNKLNTVLKKLDTLINEATFLRCQYGT